MSLIHRLFGLNNPEVKRVISSVNREVISGAYLRRRNDIVSLREYDRGQKKIDAPDIRAIVQGIRRTP